MEVRWLKRALDSLDSTARYIEHDNPDAARDLLNTIRLKTEQLATYPFMGRASETAGHPGVFRPRALPRLIPDPAGTNRNLAGVP